MSRIEIEKVATLESVLLFWGISDTTFKNDFSWAVHNQNGIECIDETNYHSIRSWLLKHTRKVQHYDKAIIEVELMKIKSTIPLEYIVRFVQEFQPLVEPFTGHKFQPTFDVLVKVFLEELEKYVGEGKYTLKRLSEKHGVPPEKVYGILKKVNEHYTPNTASLEINDYMTVDYFLTKFQLVTSDNKKAISEKNLPTVSIKFVGDFVEKRLLNFVYSGLDSTKLTEKVKNYTVLLYGNEYVLESYVSEWLYDNRIYLSNKTVAETFTSYDLVVEIEGRRVVPVTKLNEVAKLYNNGFSLTYAVALTANKITLETLRNYLTTYQLRNLLEELSNGGWVSQAFKKRLLGYPSAPALASVGLKGFSVEDIYDSLKNHVLGVSDDFPRDGYCSMSGLLDFLRSSDKRYNIPVGISEFKGDYIPHNPYKTHFIFVSSSILVINKKLLSKDLLTDYEQFAKNKLEEFSKHFEEALKYVELNRN